MAITKSLFIPELTKDDAKCEPSYCEKHVDLSFTPAQALAGRNLLNALRERRGVLENGRFVQTTADMVRWLLEQTLAVYKDGKGAAR